jgi:exosortase A
MHSPSLDVDLVRARGGSTWAAAVGALGAFVAALGALFWPAILAAVDVWYNSRTFNHCFLILPVVLWMIADRRRVLARVAPTPYPPALLALAAASLLWLVGRLATVLEAQELGLVVMLQAGTVAILGLAAARVLWFPIAYLLFLVPVGEWAVPMLQQITARFAVGGLELVGVPVFSNGLLIEIPEGKFVVAEACAGMRFLIATLAFGTLFCWLNFRAPRRIALFLLASVLVPILANSMRAFGIVLVGHVYGTDSALIADHVLYGWGFFALIIVLLTLVGLRFRDDGGRAAAPAVAVARPTRRTAGWAALAIALAAIGPSAAALIALRGHATADASRFIAPPANPPWVAHAASRWRTKWPGADAALGAAYAADGLPVELRIAYVTHQRKGAEALGFASQFLKDPEITVLEQRAATIPLADGPLEVVASRISDQTGTHLVWHWYWVNGRFTARGASAKLQQLVADLAGRQRAAALIVIATSDDRAAATRLADLLSHLPLATLLTRAGS